MNETFLKNLKGYSGCKVELLEDFDKIFVRKTSSCKAYNNRLKKQCIKQMRFASETVSAPQVLNYGYNEDADFYFDMEFVKGQTFADYSACLSNIETQAYIKLLFENLHTDNNASDNNVNAVFRQKIASLKLHLPKTLSIEKAVNKLELFDYQYVYKSLCHGDLTLENIIITPNKRLYLIDFLDSFYDSWVVDIAKLLQDLELGWSFRNIEQDTTRDIRLLIAKEALFAEIEKMEHSREIIEAAYHILLLNILRIYSYRRESKMKDFLEASIEKVVSILEKKGAER